LSLGIERPERGTRIPSTFEVSVVPDSAPEPEDEEVEVSSTFSSFFSSSSYASVNLDGATLSIIPPSISESCTLAFFNSLWPPYFDSDRTLCLRGAA